MWIGKEQACMPMTRNVSIIEQHARVSSETRLSNANPQQRQYECEAVMSTAHGISPPSSISPLKSQALAFESPKQQLKHPIQKPVSRARIITSCAAASTWTVQPPAPTRHHRWDVRCWPASSCAPCPSPPYHKPAWWQHRPPLRHARCAGQAPCMPRASSCAHQGGGQVATLSWWSSLTRKWNGVFVLACGTCHSWSYVYLWFLKWLMIMVLWKDFVVKYHSEIDTGYYAGCPYIALDSAVDMLTWCRILIFPIYGLVDKIEWLIDS